jgi:5-methyltetrahydropteroyltriglutamate--homocysteine methyltransferase
MKNSTTHIITIHAGSLPRPAALNGVWLEPTSDEATLDALLRKSVNDIVAEQKFPGVDIPNDGEFGKPTKSNLDRLRHLHFRSPLRLSSPQADTAAPETAAPGQHMRIVGQSREQRSFSQFYADADIKLLRGIPTHSPACDSPGFTPKT